MNWKTARITNRAHQSSWLKIQYTKITFKNIVAIPNWAPKSLQMMTAAMRLIEARSL